VGWLALRMNVKLFFPRHIPRNSKIVSPMLRIWWWWKCHLQSRTKISWCCLTLRFRVRKTCREVGEDDIKKNRRGEDSFAAALFWMIGAETGTPIWKNTDFLMYFKPTWLYSKAKKQKVGLGGADGEEETKTRGKKKKNNGGKEGRKEGRKKDMVQSPNQVWDLNFLDFNLK